MTASQIGERACLHFQLLTRRPHRSLRFERNIRFFVEFLVDTGRMAVECRNGVPYYRRAGED